MNTNTSLPPHLDDIGRQLVAAAHERKASPTRDRRRRARILFAVVSAAAAAALAVVVLSGAGSTPTAPGPVALAPHHHAKPSQSKLPPLMHPSGKQLLVRAAYVALQTSPVTPQPDQFVYTKIDVGHGQITQSWLSVDGTRASLVEAAGQAPLTIPGCADGHISWRMPGEDGKPIEDFIPKSLRGKPLLMSQAGKYFPGGKVPMDGPLVTAKCTPQVAFYPDMPTDPGAVQAYLVKIGMAYPANDPQVADPVNNLAKDIGYLLDTDYLLPAQQAALYRFLATTPGITVKQHVEDISGRPGIGVEWSFGGSSAMLIFDPTTYQYLGTSTIGEQRQVGGDALLQSAITNSAGAQPASAQPSPTSQSS